MEVEGTEGRCPIDEMVGSRNIAEDKIPDLSCEGACIRGEIARLPAYVVAKEEPFARVCQRKLLSVADSAMAQWVQQAEKVMVIDGCFLRCRGRIIENLLEKDKLIQFDALSVYKKHSNIFNIDDVQFQDRQQAAEQVSEFALASLRTGD